MFGISALADAPFASFAGVYDSSVTETGTATDAAVGYITFPASISETGTATDSIEAAQSFASSVSETGTATDAAVGYIAFPASISETGTATDSTVGYVIFPASISETGTATDIIGAAQLFGSAILETSTATDVVIGNFLWNPIDDTQNANWTLVPTNEIPTGMDSVFGGGAFASTPIAGLSWTYVPGAGWTVVTNNTTTDWQIIGTVN